MSRSDPNDALQALGQARPTSAAAQRIAAGAWGRIEHQRRSWVPAAVATALVLGALTIGLWPAAPSAESVSELRIGAHRVAPAGDAHVEVISADPEAAVVAVTSGRADFDIEPLGDGFFRVQAPGARVEVIGTRFSVNANDSCTEITVTEGKVRVTGDRRVVSLGRGERARFCEGSDAGPEGTASHKGVATQPIAAQERVTPAPKDAVRAEEVPKEAPSGAAVGGETLVRNALAHIADGVELDAAAHDLEQYLRQWPRGVFAEEAMFHTALLAHRQEADNAQHLAERFLRHFPTGRRAERVRALGDGVGAPADRLHR